jgi:hypothetical protein
MSEDKSISDLRLLISGLCAVLFVLCSVAQAQQPKKVPRIVYLSGIARAGESPRSDGIRLELRELGYIDYAVHEQIDKALIPGENSNTWKVQSAVPNMVRAIDQ